MDWTGRQSGQRSSIALSRRRKWDAGGNAHLGGGELPAVLMPLMRNLCLDDISLAGRQEEVGFRGRAGGCRGRSSVRRGRIVGMVAALDNAPVLDHQDLVGAANGGQAGGR